MELNYNHRPVGFPLLREECSVIQEGQEKKEKEKKKETEKEKKTNKEKKFSRFLPFSAQMS